MSDRMRDVQLPQEYGKENILTRIREGMEVYDRDGKRVGTVQQVYMGSVGDQAVESGGQPTTVSRADVQDATGFPDNLLTGLTRDRDLPETVRGRLLHDGFMRVDGHGLLSSGRLVERDQIESVSGDRVTLNAAEADLIKK
jgi:hypothetical protein